MLAGKQGAFEFNEKYLILVLIFEALTFSS
jgi:hypothetical protein